MGIIVAGILSLLMVLGGIIPYISNKTFEDTLRPYLNNPEKLEVKTYSYPSYTMLGGGFNRVEIKAKKIKFMNIDFEEFKLIAEPLKMEYSQMANAKGLEFIKNGKADAMLVLSSESLEKFVDINDLSTKINNILSNFKLPIPIVSGSISVSNLGIKFENNHPTISGNLISMGGLISVPFTVSADIIVTAKNTLEVYKPQITVMNEPLVIDEIQDMVKYVNPVLDLNKMNNTGLNVQLKNLYFKDNKLKVLATISSK